MYSEYDLMYYDDDVEKDEWDSNFRNLNDEVVKKICPEFSCLGDSECKNCTTTNPYSLLCDELPCDEQNHVFLPDANDAVIKKQPSKSSKRKMCSCVGPRALLALASILYGTIFPLTSMINHSYTPSAALSARFFVASIALFPFLFQLERKKLHWVLISGCFEAMNCIAESLALVYVRSSLVAFFSGITVIICPFLEYIFDEKDMSFRNAPQTWLAIVLCLVGIGFVELSSHEGATVKEVLSDIGIGDGLAALSAVASGIHMYMNEKIMVGKPELALPLVASEVSVTACISFIWCSIELWTEKDDDDDVILWQPTWKEVIIVLWLAIGGTVLASFLENYSWGKIKSAEGSVILATESFWGAAFSAILLKEVIGLYDFLGGFFIVTASLVQDLKRDDFCMSHKYNSERKTTDALIVKTNSLDTESDVIQKV